MVGAFYSHEHGAKPSHESKREYPDYSERIKPQPGSPDAGVRQDNADSSSDSSSEAKRKSDTK